MNYPIRNFFQVQKDFLCFLMTIPLIMILIMVAVNTFVQLVTRCLCNVNSPSRACAGINHFLLCLAKIIHYNLKFKVHRNFYFFSQKKLIK